MLQHTIYDLCTCVCVWGGGGAGGAGGAGGRACVCVCVHTCMYIKAKMYAISSDTHQLQFLKLHHFKQERF